VNLKTKFLIVSCAIFALMVFTLLSGKQRVAKAPSAPKCKFKTVRFGIEIPQSKKGEANATDVAHTRLLTQIIRVAEAWNRAADFKLLAHDPKKPSLKIGFPEDFNVARKRKRKRDIATPNPGDSEIKEIRQLIDERSGDFDSLGGYLSEKGKPRIVLEDDYEDKLLEKILAHQLGHFLGFAHSDDPSSIMYPIADHHQGVDGLTLSSGDIAVARELCGYPKKVEVTPSTTPQEESVPSEELASEESLVEQ
jgi:hypothetical protein